MVKRPAGGKFGSILVLAMLVAGGQAACVRYAAAQESTAEDEQPVDLLAPLIRLRPLNPGQSAQDSSLTDPFNDGPLEADGQAQTEQAQTEQAQTGDSQDGTGNATGINVTDGSSDTETEAEVAAARELESDTQGRTRAAEAETAVLDPINTATPDARANLREQQVEPGTKRPEEIVDPFLLPGFRAGTWQVFTRLEQAVGYSNNNSFAAGGKPGAFLQTDGSVTLRSDWSRHEAQIEATGTLVKAMGDGQPATPTAGVNGSLRLDLIDGFSATLRGNYDYSTEALSSTSLVSGVAERPAVHAFGGSAELARTGGYFDFSLRGSADRTAYEAAVLDSGGTFSQNDRNNTLYQLTARTAFGPTPSIKPFVQGGIGWREYDLGLDRNGEDRSSMLFDLRAGVQFDLHDKLKGEMAVGYAWEDFNAPTLKTLNGITLNGTLDWSPERDTNLRFTASTGFSGSTTAGDNGSLVYTLQAEAVRRVRDNLAVNASASYGHTYYDTTGGTDHAYKVGAGVEYWISRYVSLTADVDYEILDSATAGSSWDATSVRIGLAMQR